MKKYLYHYLVSFIIAAVCVYSIYKVHYFNHMAFNTDVMEIISGTGEEKFFYSDESKEQLMVFYQENTEYFGSVDFESKESVYGFFSKIFGFLLQLTKNISFDEINNMIRIKIKLSEKDEIILTYTYHKNNFRLESFENLQSLNPIIRCINS